MPGVSLVAVSMRYSLDLVLGLITAVTSQSLAVAGYRLSCSETHGIFPDQGSSPHPLHWQADS